MQKGPAASSINISQNTSNDENSREGSEKMECRRWKMDLTHYVCTKEFFVVSLIPRPQKTWGMLLCRKCACALGEDIHILPDATLVNKHSIHSRSYVFQTLRHRKCFLCSGDTFQAARVNTCFQCFSTTLLVRKHERPRGSIIDDPSHGVIIEEFSFRVPEGGIAHYNV